MRPIEKTNFYTTFFDLVHGIESGEFQLIESSLYNDGGDGNTVNSHYGFVVKRKVSAEVNKFTDDYSTSLQTSEVVDQLKQINKTLQTIASSQERDVKIDSASIAKAVKKTLDGLFEPVNYKKSF